MRSHQEITAIAALLLIGCSAESPQAPDPPSPLFRAEVVTLFKGWFPLTPPPAGILNVCSGERIHFSGEYNLIVRMVTSASGRTQFRVHSQANVKGTGAVSGEEYVSVDLLNLTENAGSDGAAVFTMRYNLNTVGKGGVPNVKGYIESHLTVNANGEVTRSNDTFVFDECQK